MLAKLFPRRAANEYEYAGRLLLGRAKPVELSGTAPGEIGNYLFIPLALIMLVSALRKRRA